MAIKTINLAGAEVEVTGLDGCNAHIRNDGTSMIYAAKTAGVSAGKDGVISIPAGQPGDLRGISGTLYMLGTGTALVQSDDYVESPFKASTASGGSAVDEQARAAVEAHAGNTELHATAVEKAVWNGKADKSDIPTKTSELTNDSGYITSPDGGNADKVGGYSPASIMKFVRDGNPTVDCNDCTESGWYFFNGCGGHSPINNSTLGMGGYFFLITWQYNPSYIMQAAMYVHGTAAWIGKTYTRCCNNGVWSDWDTLARSSDITHA